MTHGKGSTIFADTTFEAEPQYWCDTRGKSVSPSHLIKVKGVLGEVLPKMGRLKPTEDESLLKAVLNLKEVSDEIFGFHAQ